MGRRLIGGLGLALMLAGVLGIVHTQVYIDCNYFPYDLMCWLF